MATVHWVQSCKGRERMHQVRLSISGLHQNCHVPACHVEIHAPCFYAMQLSSGYQVQVCTSGANNLGEPECDPEPMQKGTTGTSTCCGRGRRDAHIVVRNVPVDPRSFQRHTRPQWVAVNVRHLSATHCIALHTLSSRAISAAPLPTLQLCSMWLSTHWHRPVQQQASHTTRQ
jgi:hypothetical protein